MMLKSILGSANRERVLLFIHCRHEGYARQIARFYGAALRPVQQQLEKLESARVLYSRKLGTTRVYAFSSRYPFFAELQALLAKALALRPESDRKALTAERHRPGRAGQPA